MLLIPCLPFLLRSRVLFYMLSPLPRIHSSCAAMLFPPLRSSSRPSLFAALLQIPALGIRADAVTFANCTMESEKFITVREMTGDAVMIHMVLYYFHIFHNYYKISV